MQVKTTQVGGTGQAATVIDSEALGLQITQLESLYNTWLDTSEAAPDVGGMWRKYDNSNRGDRKYVSKNAGFICAVAQQYFVIYEGKKIIHRYKGK